MSVIINAPAVFLIDRTGIP